MENKNQSAAVPAQDSHSTRTRLGRNYLELETIQKMLEETITSIEVAKQDALSVIEQTNREADAVPSIEDLQLDIQGVINTLLVLSNRLDSIVIFAPRNLKSAIAQLTANWMDIKSELQKAPDAVNYSIAQHVMHARKAVLANTKVLNDRIILTKQSLTAAAANIQELENMLLQCNELEVQLRQEIAAHGSRIKEQALLIQEEKDRADSASEELHRYAARARQLSLLLIEQMELNPVEMLSDYILEPQLINKWLTLVLVGYSPTAILRGPSWDKVLKQSKNDAKLADRLAAFAVLHDCVADHGNDIRSRALKEVQNFTTISDSTDVDGARMARLLSVLMVYDYLKRTRSGLPTSLALTAIYNQINHRKMSKLVVSIYDQVVDYYRATLSGYVSNHESLQRISHSMTWDMQMYNAKEFNYELMPKWFSA